jgi:hypothetical protein
MAGLNQFQPGHYFAKATALNLQADIQLIRFSALHEDCNSSGKESESRWLWYDRDSVNERRCAISGVNTGKSEVNLR